MDLVDNVSTRTTPLGIYGGRSPLAQSQATGKYLAMEKTKGVSFHRLSKIRDIQRLMTWQWYG